MDEATPAPPAQPPPAPVAPEERIELVDALRGLALLGIAIVNVGYFAHPVEVRMFGAPPGEGTLNLVVVSLIQAFVEGKFYTLFSLLFGFGLFVHLTRAEQRGDPAALTRLWRRRLLVLLGFGVLHGVFIWAGDVLSAYALLGFLALRFRNTTQRRLVVWAIRLTVALAALMAILGWLVTLIPPDRAADDATLADVAEAYRVYGHGSYLEVTRLRASHFLEGLLSWGFLAPSILAMFALGIWVGRAGLLRDPARHRATLRRMLILTIAIGVPADLVYLAMWRTLAATPGLPHTDYAPMLFGLAASLIAGPALCLSYVSGAALLWLRPGPRRALALLAPAGRMPLTNYLAQSLIGTTIAYSYGLGLFGKIGAAAGLGLAVAIFGAQVLWSRWWLGRHRFGPAEWSWRTLTYGAAQPLRRGR